MNVVANANAPVMAPVAVPMMPPTPGAHERPPMDNGPWVAEVNANAPVMRIPEHILTKMTGFVDFKAEDMPRALPESGSPGVYIEPLPGVNGANLGKIIYYRGDGFQLIRTLVWQDMDQDTLDAVFSDVVAWQTKPGDPTDTNLLSQINVVEARGEERNLWQERSWVGATDWVERRFNCPAPPDEADLAPLCDVQCVSGAEQCMIQDDAFITYGTARRPSVPDRDPGQGSAATRRSWKSAGLAMLLAGMVHVAVNMHHAN